jgi:hypothetical protein
VTMTSVADVVTVAKEVLGLEGRKMNAKAEDSKFQSFFGAPASVIAKLWDMIQPLDDSAAQLKHLLWVLVFLFVYSTEEVHC